MQLATFQLEGDADDWWTTTRRLKFPDSITVDIKWKDFEATFHEKYFPSHVQNWLDREFRNLQQGSMTVAEYEATFAWLERFAQAFDSEERRANRFLEGLQPNLRVKVMGYGWGTKGCSGF